MPIISHFYIYKYRPIRASSPFFSTAAVNIFQLQQLGVANRSSRQLQTAAVHESQSLQLEN